MWRYIVEGRRSLVDILNSGSIGGASGSGGACSTGSFKPLLLSTPAPP